MAGSWYDSVAEVMKRRILLADSCPLFKTGLSGTSLFFRRKVTATQKWRLVSDGDGEDF